ncbi:SGNH/GDSL hydrolase family protein [Geodermatophilus normandii]|uniref:SGNH/GDSL hydrolase family protein n=1 Tax=Geodermatophilus normandii TaxID=1137989 RepID=A0A6P0GFA4_9ACTN|nr:SGNH/GDSL hydrolase family protein [Geodermatophilus normandii]NEM05947.1 SGNH/GDSL hydrolase family protein [Geodermatophilus normandii]
MARGDHWWNEPPLWSWIAMVAGLIAIVVMFPAALDRPAPPSSRGDGTAVTGEGPSAIPSASPQPSDEPADPVRVLVIGDSDSGGDDRVEAAWPTLLEERLPGTAVDAVTTGDAGYVTTAGRTTLTSLAAGADLADADLVVLSGSRFDASGIADRVSASAQEAIDTVRDGAPEATLIVIGPVWPGGSPPAGVRNNRDVIRAAAEAADVSFVDPLTEGWLAEGTGLVGEDDVHLTDEGQAALADLVQPVVEAELDEATPATTGG